MREKEKFFDRVRPVFAPDGADKLAEYCLKYWPEDVAHVLRRAKDACRNTFLFDFNWDMERTVKPVRFEGEIDWSLIPEGDREFLWQFNRCRFLLCLAQSWRLSGEETYAVHFVRLLTDWIRRAEEGENIDLGPHRTLETGIRAEIWLRSAALVEDAPCVDDAFIRLLEESLNAHAVRLLENFSPHKYMSNWGVLESSGLLLLSIAMPEGTLKERCREEAVKRLVRSAQTQVLPDGTQWEQSPMYHNEVYRCFLNAVYYGERAGLAVLPELRETVRKMAYVDAVWKKPDHTQFIQGDSDASDLQDQITAGAFVLKDGTLKAFGYGRLDFESAWQFGYKACLFYEELKPEKPSFTSAQLPFGGNYYFRSGWEENAGLLHFHCGDTGGGHGHADKLHVDLVINGEDVLTDSGRFTYVDGPDRYSLKEPEAHNVVIVDGSPFSRCETSWIYSSLCTCLKQPFFEGKLGALAEGSHLGYQERGILANRRVIWLKPDIYVIADTFYGTGTHTYEALFHFDRKGTLTEYGCGVRFQTEKTIAFVQTLQPGAARGIRRTRQSCRYNELAENETFYESESGEGMYSRFTVINGGPAESAAPVQVRRQPLYSCVHGKNLDMRDACALCITAGDREFVLFLCQREVMTPTDIFSWENCFGCGRVVLFDRTAEKREHLTGETLSF